MRKVCFLLTLGFGLSLLAPAARAEDKVGWMTDLAAAQRLAAQSNKLVLVHFWAPWCKPCLKMDSTVFADEAVGPTLKRQYVLVKLNLDNYQGLAMKYGVRTIPADVVVDASGNLLQHQNSPRSASLYVSTFQTVAAAYLPAQDTTRMASAVAMGSADQRASGMASSTAASSTAASYSGYGQIANQQHVSPNAATNWELPGYRSQINSRDGHGAGDKYAARDRIPYRERVPEPYLPERTVMDDSARYREMAAQFTPPSQDIRSQYDPNHYVRYGDENGAIANPFGAVADPPGMVHNPFATGPITDQHPRAIEPKSINPLVDQSQGATITPPETAGSPASNAGGDRYAGDSRYGVGSAGMSSVYHTRDYGGANLANQGGAGNPDNRGAATWQTPPSSANGGNPETNHAERSLANGESRFPPYDISTSRQQYLPLTQSGTDRSAQDWQTPPTPQAGDAFNNIQQGNRFAPGSTGPVNATPRNAGVAPWDDRRSAASAPPASVASHTSNASLPWNTGPAATSQGNAVSAPSPGQSQTASNQPPIAPVPEIPPGNPPLAFQGFCPVTMTNTLAQGGRWVRGNTSWGAMHEGRTFLFASEDAQRKFLAEPDRYAPLVAGIDIVHFLESGDVRDGDVQHGVFINGRILLFSSEENLQKFSRTPDDYFNGLRQAQMENRLRIR